LYTTFTAHPDAVDDENEQSNPQGPDPDGAVIEQAVEFWDVPFKHAAKAASEIKVETKTARSTGGV
jgi:hypothetical protein